MHSHTAINRTIRATFIRRAPAHIPEVVNDQIEPRFWNRIDQPWQHLQRAVPVAEHDHVVSDELVGLQRNALLCQHLELCLGGFSVVQAEVVASFEVDAEGGVCRGRGRGAGQGERGVRRRRGGRGGRGSGHLHLHMTHAARLRPLLLRPPRAHTGTQAKHEITASKRPTPLHSTPLHFTAPHRMHSTHLDVPEGTPSESPETRRSSPACSSTWPHTR